MLLCGNSDFSIVPPKVFHLLEDKFVLEINGTNHEHRSVKLEFKVEHGDMDGNESFSFPDSFVVVAGLWLGDAPLLQIGRVDLSGGVFVGLSENLNVLRRHSHLLEGDFGLTAFLGSEKTPAMI